MKFNKTILSFFLTGIILSANVFADNCPSTPQIRQGNLNGWIVYLCSDGSGFNSCKPATPKEIKEFENAQIILPSGAYWFGYNIFPANSMCAYGGTLIIKSQDTIQLFKTESKPSGSQWQVLGTKPYTMYCQLNGDTNNCLYP